MTSKMLEGIRVIDMTEVWAGPMGNSLLADLGADVIKIESFPRQSSITRTSRGVALDGDGPPWERNSLHHMANRNKRNLTLNIRSDEGAEALRKLISIADVLVDGYSAGTLQRIGFGWDDVHELNPNLVMLSMPGWGVTGPYQGYVTLGSGLDSTSGHAMLRGYPGRPVEEIPSILHTDATGALGVVQAVLAGLFQREKNDNGMFIDMSQTEAFVWQMPGATAEYDLNGRVPPRLGNADPHVVPHGCYRAGGGEASEVSPESSEPSWVVIAARNDAQWHGIATASGNPEWADIEHPWSTVVGRLRARADIDAGLAAYAATGTAEEISDAISTAGGIAAPVKHAVSFLSDPQFAERGWLQSVEHAYMGLQLMPGFLWSISPDEASVEIPCGLLGERNREILEEIGYTDKEISELEDSGVIGNVYPT